MVLFLVFNMRHTSRDYLQPPCWWKEQVSVWRPVLTVKMVNSCCVRDCTKKTGDRVGAEKVTFHRIPTVIKHHDAETKKLTEKDKGSG